MNDDPPSSSSSASNIEGGLIRFRRSSKCSFHRPITFSVEVNSVPSLLYTAWMVPRFPLLRCRTVFQKGFGAVLRACRYLATASGVPWDYTSRKASFFSRTASLTTGLLPLEVPITLRPQLPAVASAIEALNITHRP